MASLNPNSEREQRVAVAGGGDNPPTAHPISPVEREARLNTVRDGRVPGVIGMFQGEVVQESLDRGLKGYLQNLGGPTNRDE
jgi:hypothetical protein